MTDKFLDIKQEALEELELEEKKELDKQDQRLKLARKIIEMANRKEISILTTPIKIIFELDDAEDLANNYSISQLTDTHDLIKNFNDTSEDFNEYINSMDYVYKYKNGKIIEKVDEEDEIWRKFVPSCIKNKVRKTMSIEEVCEIIEINVKNYERFSPNYMKLMDFKIDLQEIIHGREYAFDSNEIDEFSEYEFSEYVRTAVESIILPHIEVLKLLEERHGNVKFLDVWEQHFSDKLKEEVKHRDGYKCIVCDEETNLHVHHKIPRKLGGPNHPDNLVTLCSSCHGVIETADIEKAYRKCMTNCLKKKISIQKIDYSNDIYLIKQEVLEQLESLFIKFNVKDEGTAGEILEILKKVEYIFE